MGKRHLMNVTLVLHTTQELGVFIISGSSHTHDPYDTRHLATHLMGADQESDWDELYAWVAEVVAEQLGKRWRQLRTNGMQAESAASAALDAAIVARHPEKRREVGIRAEHRAAPDIAE